MADNEPQDRISRIHRFFGLKPSAEQQQKIADSQAALERMRSLGEPLRAAVEEEIDLRKAELQESTRQAQAGLDQLREQRAHQPRQIDRVPDLEFTPDGKLIVKGHIQKWDDGNGYVVYSANTGTKDIVRSTEIQPLSTRIQAQRTSFGQLEADERSRIRGEFDSLGGNASSAKPYGEYFRNEALGDKFAAIKANPPTRPSFGRK